jgi:hypothetical protein
MARKVVKKATPKVVNKAVKPQLICYDDGEEVIIGFAKDQNEIEEEYFNLGSGRDLNCYDISFADESIRILAKQRVMVY